MMKPLVLAWVVFLVASCANTEEPADATEFFGTLEPFASEAVYFIVTDRFVDGDPTNNYPDQGGQDHGTFDRPIQLPDSLPANIGYLGGDFMGVLNNADYIANMGMTAVWLTPVVDNPDEAFTGGKEPGEGGSNDKGKTGYHGYWGVNFFALDEHLPSAGLGYKELTHRLLANHGIKTILDVVCNHGSPSFSMSHDQPKYGELFDAADELVADHNNLYPTELDADNPLHSWYRQTPDLAELSDMNFDNPEVLDYFVEAHSKWIGQGAAAIRIDTIKHMPHSFWKDFSDRLRARHPDLFMFAEAWSFDEEILAEFTLPENGGISVLDFPGRQAMLDAFGLRGGSYTDLLEYLHVDSGIYQNPYELMTFYDNHDMTRIDADAAGLVDANNWLFTSRGIPVVYYGSEIGFRAGADQHGGNRDYFGQENIELAKSHPIRAALADIAAIRKSSVALQRGLQLNLEMTDDTAAFYRVFQQDGHNQTALVLLNKGASEIIFDASEWLYEAAWFDASGSEELRGNEVHVPAHGVRVILTNAAFIHTDYLDELVGLHLSASRD